MAITSILGPLGGVVGTALLQRTFLLETQTDNGIPRPLAVFDAITQETPEFTADVTKHPVEKGREITDHIQPQNPSLKLVGVISNSPLDLSTSIANLAAAGWDAVTSAQARSNILNTGLQQAAGVAGAKLLGGAANPLSKGLSGATDAIARSILLDCVDRSAIFDVITARQRYTSMTIERLSFPRDPNTGAALYFEMDLVSVRIVSSLQVQINTVSENVTSSATSKVNIGSQAAAGTSDQALGAVNKSWLRSITKGLGG